MTPRTRLLIGFLVGFFAVGIPYWLIPYNRLSLPNALMGAGLLVVAGVALVLRLRVTSTFWRTVAIASAAVPAAVFARVVWDGFRDPSSHNLWPFEVIIAVLMGFACALAGAVAGALLASLIEKRTASRS